jgi:hypothetical protein
LARMLTPTIILLRTPSPKRTSLAAILVLLNACIGGRDA